MGIKLTVEFDNMVEALDFLQSYAVEGQPATPASPKKAAPKKKAAAKPTPGAAAPSPQPATPPAAAVAAAGPVITDAELADQSFGLEVNGLAAAGHLEALKALMLEFKVARASELDLEQRRAFLTRARQIAQPAVLL